MIVSYWISFGSRFRIFNPNYLISSPVILYNTTSLSKDFYPVSEILDNLQHPHIASFNDKEISVYILLLTRVPNVLEFFYFSILKELHKKL